MSVSLDESVSGVVRPRAERGRLWVPLAKRAAERPTLPPASTGSSAVAAQGAATPTFSPARPITARPITTRAVPTRAVPTRGIPVEGSQSRGRVRWWPPFLVVTSVLASCGLNAAAIGAAQRPGWLGMTASVFFLASWVGYLAATRRTHRHAALRRLNACWAATIAGSALTASVVGLQLSPLGGHFTEGVLAVVSLLLAAPLYGLTGLVGGDHFPLGMAGLAVACYLGLLAFAMAGWHAAAHEPAEHH